MEKSIKENKEIEKRKEKLKSLFVGNYKGLIISLFIIIFLIRIYYFSLTINQPLWWDESDYMATAKSFAGLGNYKLESIRLPTFPFLVSIFFKLGFTEPMIRFFVLLIPSLLLIFLTYYLIKEMYVDKRIALISALFLSVLWEHLFYSNRFHTENISLIFEFLALIVLVKCYTKKEKFLFIKSKHSLYFVFILSMAAVFFRPGNIIFFPGVFIFILLSKGNVIFKNKKNTLYSFLLLIFAFIALMVILSKFSIPIISSYYHPERSVAWVHLTVFEGFFQPINQQLPNLIYYSFCWALLYLFLDSH